MQKKWDVLVVGGGPGGYVAALRAAQLKRKVVLIEDDRVGGTCINYGCIPTKYLLYHTHLLAEVKQSRVVDGPLRELRINWERMQEEKKAVVDKLVSGLEFLLEKSGVEVVKGRASLVGERKVVVRKGEDEVLLEGERVILAMGSSSSDVPFIKPNRREIVTSQEALEFESIPKTLLIVGAGVIGVELGTLYQRLGTDVKILEILPALLPGWDREIVSRLQRILKVQGVTIFTQMRIEECVVKRGAVSLRGTCLRDNSSFSLEGERVLLAAGRKPNSDSLKASPPGIELDEFGYVKVDARLETNIPGIYAIGDLTGGKLLAHKASHEGIAAAENATGGKKQMDYRALPSAVFTDPELTSIGLTEEEAQAKGIQARIGRFPLKASGRALTMSKDEGMIKVVADEKGKILGAHILAPSASEMIAEVSLAMAKGLKVEDVASAFHVHPTLSEAVMEASMKVQNMAIHILNV